MLVAPALELTVISDAATVTSLRVRSRDGQLGNVVLGPSEFRAFKPNPHYIGAVVGRYANRIAAGRFGLGATDFQLANKNCPHHLHGGVMGFDQYVGAVTASEFDDGVSFERLSPAGEEQYPGVLKASVTYRVIADNSVEIRYAATTDADTPVNLTQHRYFNLSADPSSPIVDHELTMTHLGAST